MGTFEARSCARKVAIGKKKEAAAEAARLRKRGGDCRAYHCRFCGAYHVGHPISEAALEFYAERSGR